MRHFLSILFIVLLFSFCAQDDPMINSLVGNDVNIEQNDSTQTMAIIKKVLIGVDTTFVFDTLYSLDSTFVFDTTVVIDSVFKLDTTFVFDTLVSIDSLFRYDTLFVFDTTVILDSLIRFDTTVVLDTLTVKDSVFRKDTVITKDTLNDIDTILGIEPLKIVWCSINDGDTGITARNNLRTNGLYNGYVFVEFNNRIDKARTGYKFIKLITDDTLAYIDSSINSKWIGGAIFEMRLNYYTICNSYKIIIDSVYDIAGQTLSKPDTITFTPEPYFRIVSIGGNVPTSTTVPVPISSSNNIIRVEFNSTTNKDTVQNYMSINNSATIDWTGSWIYVFNAVVGTDYTITINSTLPDDFGNTLGKEYSLTFTY